MKKEYIEKITSLLEQTDDMQLLDLIYQLLNQEKPSTSVEQPTV